MLKKKNNKVVLTVTTSLKPTENYSMLTVP